MATTYRLEAIEILRKHKNSLKASEIADEIIKRGNVVIRGKTPSATLYSILMTEIKKRGSGSAFIMKKKGYFSLKSRVR